MENLLRSKGCWSMIETGYEEPVADVLLSEAQQKEQHELMMKDLKAKIIYSRLLTEQFLRQYWRNVLQSRYGIL